MNQLYEQALLTGQSNPQSYAAQLFARGSSVCFIENESDKPLNPESSPLTEDTVRAMRVLAKNTYKELKTAGYTPDEIRAFVEAMLNLVNQQEDRV